MGRSFAATSSFLLVGLLLAGVALTITLTPTSMFSPAKASAGSWPMCHHDPRNTGSTEAPGPSDKTLQWKFETGGGVESSPAVANGEVYVGSDDNRVYALDAETGELEWKFETGDDVGSSPAVANEKVYVGSVDNCVYALDAETGELEWKFETGDDVVFSSPAVAYGKVYVGSFDDYVYAIGKARYPTPTPPGFELLFSVAALTAVAYLLRRQKR